LQRFLREHFSEHPRPLGEFHVFVNESLCVTSSRDSSS